MEDSYSYQKLDVWTKSMDLVIEIYKLTNHFPKSEKYGLALQMNRCAVSIPSNIAEGQRRAGKNDKLRFYRFAFSSGAEPETQILIAKRLKFIEFNYHKVDKLLSNTMRMLNKLAYPGYSYKTNNPTSH